MALGVPFDTPTVDDNERLQQKMIRWYMTEHNGDTKNARSRTSKMDNVGWTGESVTSIKTQVLQRSILLSRRPDCTFFEHAMIGGEWNRRRHVCKKANGRRIMGNNNSSSSKH
jgi:hypothetical protein